MQSSGENNKAPAYAECIRWAGAIFNREITAI
jgi:hypothetical protein